MSAVNSRVVVTLELDAPAYLSVVRENNLHGASDVDDYEAMPADVAAALATKVGALYEANPDLGDVPTSVFAWWYADGAVDMTARHLTSQPMRAEEAQARFASLAAESGIPTDFIEAKRCETAGEELLQLAEDRDVHEGEMGLLQPLLEGAIRASRIALPKGGS